MTILVANPRGNKIGNWTLWIYKKNKVLTFFLFKQKNQIFSKNLMRKKNMVLDNLFQKYIYIYIYTHTHKNFLNSTCAQTHIRIYKPQFFMIHSCIHVKELHTYKGCVWFDVNRIPSVKWMQGKMNSCKENEIQVFGSAMENSLENDFQCLVTFWKCYFPINASHFLSFQTNFITENFKIHT